MTHDREPCQLVPIWLMPLHLENGHTGCVFMVAKLKKKDRLGFFKFKIGPNIAP